MTDDKYAEYRRGVREAYDFAYYITQHQHRNADEKLDLIIGGLRNLAEGMVTPPSHDQLVPVSMSADIRSLFIAITEYAHDSVPMQIYEQASAILNNAERAALSAPTSKSAEAVEIVKRIKDAAQHWGGWSGTAGQCDRLLELFATPSAENRPAQDDLRTPRYDEWRYLREHGQWSNGVPEWARDYSGSMNDFTAATAVIEELAAIAAQSAKEPL